MHLIVPPLPTKWCSVHEQVSNSVFSVTYHRHTVFSLEHFFNCVGLSLWNKQHTKISPHLHFTHESANRIRNSNPHFTLNDIRRSAFYRRSTSTALLNRTVCRFRRSNCQPSAIKRFQSQQHSSATGFLTMSRRPIRCRLFSSN